MSPRLYRVVLPLFLIVYAVAGFLGHSLVGGPDVYPFFAWGLYADAAPIEVQYGARLLEIDGRALPAPVELLETPAFHRSPDYWRDVGVLTRYGAALEAGDAAAAAPLRRLFEANVLIERRVRYEMVRRTYAPLERRATGTYRETSLGVFLKDGAAERGR